MEKNMETTILLGIDNILGQSLCSYIRDYPKDTFLPSWLTISEVSDFWHSPKSAYLDGSYCGIRANNSNILPT